MMMMTTTMTTMMMVSYKVQFVSFCYIKSYTQNICKIEFTVLNSKVFMTQCALEELPGETIVKLTKFNDIYSWSIGVVFHEY